MFQEKCKWHFSGELKTENYQRIVKKNILKGNWKHLFFWATETVNILGELEPDIFQGYTTGSLLMTTNYLLYNFLCCFIFIFIIFTDSAPWASSVIELPCPSVCLSVCVFVTSRNTLFRRSWRPLVKKLIPNIGL